MRHELGEIKMGTGNGRQSMPSLPTLKLHVVDAAFADLEPTALREVEPSPGPTGISREGLVEHLSSQLRAMEEQRLLLANLLNELETLVPAEV